MPSSSTTESQNRAKDESEADVQPPKLRLSTSAGEAAVDAAHSTAAMASELNIDPPPLVVRYPAFRLMMPAPKATPLLLTKPGAPWLTTMPPVWVPCECRSSVVAALSP